MKQEPKKWQEAVKKRNPLFRAVAFLLAFTVSFTGVPIPDIAQFGVKNAEAAQVKRVQTSSSTFTEFDTSLTASLSYAIDVDQSLLLISATANDLHAPSSKGGLTYNGGEGPAFFSGFFEDGTTVNLARDRGDSDADLDADVQQSTIEFNDGVVIHQGFTSFSPSTYQKNIALPTLQAGTYFPIIAARTGEWDIDETEAFTFRATFPDSNTLRVERNDVPVAVGNTPAAGVNIVWQVMELRTDASVRSGTVSIPYNATSQTVTLNPAITNINKTFLVFNYMGGAGIDGADAMLHTRGTITNTTTLTFTRGQAGSTGDQIDIAWYLVELTDSSSNVQRGTSSFSAGVFSNNVTLSAIDPARAFPIVSGSLAASTLQNLWHEGLFKVGITNSTTLNISRRDDPGVTEGAATAAWVVVEFSPLTVKSPNGGEVWYVGNAQNITWKHAASLDTGGTCGGGAGPGHKLKIELSKDGGATYPLTITSDVCADLDTYLWTIPPVISAQNLIDTDLRIKITDTDYTASANNFDVSNANFEVKGTLTLTSPVGGEDWVVGDMQNITWNNTGDFDGGGFTGTLSYSTAGSNGPWTVIGSSISLGTDSGSGGSNSEPWQVQDLLGSNTYIKLERNGDTTGTTTVSSAPFNIKRSLVVTAPNGGQTIKSLEATNITWDYRGETGWGTVKLEYSKNGGVDWNTIATGQSVGTGVLLRAQAHTRGVLPMKRSALL